LNYKFHVFWFGWPLNPIPLSPTPLSSSCDVELRAPVSVLMCVCVKVRLAPVCVYSRFRLRGEHDDNGTGITHFQSQITSTVFAVFNISYISTGLTHCLPWHKNNGDLIAHGVKS